MVKLAGKVGKHKPGKRLRKPAARAKAAARQRMAGPRKKKDALPKKRPSAGKAVQSKQPSKAPPPRLKMRRGSSGSVASLLDELRKSDDRFRSLIETAATPILLLSAELVVIEFNEEAEQLYGLQRRSVVGRGYFSALDPDEHGGLTRSDFSEVLAGRPARAIEGRVRRPDGSERFLLWSARRLTDSSKRPLSVIAVAQDITERQKAEEALKEREARMSSIIATAPDAIITIDEMGIVQSFSSAAERLFGYVAGEVIGRNVKMIMPSPHREDHDAYLARYRRTGEKRIIGIGRRVEARRKDGSVFPIELAVGEVHVGGTRIFTGFIRDITVRTKMEEDLRQAQKMEAIGQLTGGVAHDFNNLLTVISGNLEMLERRIERPDDRGILGEAQEAAELGAKLANRLLAFGRRQSLNPKPVDLGALASSMLDLLRRSLGGMIGIETRFADGLSLTMVDPGLVENALLNLAINARDAMPQGGRLFVETANVQIDPDFATGYVDVTPGPYVMLAVTDTGVGMSEEVRQRAFEPFFTTKGAGVGSGLGLSMVYGFVKQSGGHIQLYSEPGRGTTVRVYLPARASSDSAIKERGTAASSRAVNGEIILVVEDDARVRKVSVRRLKELGYRVVEADGGASALKELRKSEPIDLLFTDIVMPGMTGTALAREARRHRPGLKILFTSGYSDSAVIEDDMPSDNADWLGKPYSTADLAAKLRNLLGG